MKGKKKMAETTAKRKLVAKIQLPIDPLNKKDMEVVFERFDKDPTNPEVIGVRRGETVTVPVWVAERAFEIELINSYEIVEE